MANPNGCGRVIAKLRERNGVVLGMKCTPDVLCLECAPTVAELPDAAGLLSKDQLQRLTRDAEKLVQHGDAMATLGRDIVSALRSIRRKGRRDA